MGANQFNVRTVVPKTRSLQDAFIDARSDAQHESGHGGYTGTLAEKSDVVLLHTAKSEANASRLVSAYSGSSPPVLCQAELDRVDDKWGPAGAIRFPIDAKTDGIFFFGWASS